MYAIIEISGKQFRVDKGNELKIPYQQHMDTGKKISFDRILLVDDGKAVSVGQPIVSGFRVEATIVEHGRDRIIPVFKKKRRKGYRVKNTHRQNYTVIRVEDIKASASEKTAKVSQKGE